MAWVAGGGYASLPLPQRRATNFLPLLRIPRGTRNFASHRPPLTFRPSGCGGHRPCLKPAIEAANERGFDQTTRRNIMANIGTFKQSGDNSYTGEIVTMSLQKKNVTVVPEAPSENENAPSHQVFISRAEVGAAWQKSTKEGRDYLSIKLDDPSFTAPIFASLFADDDGKTFNLIWSRARTSNGN
jgi:uncharacterized protein (DUF736 family)